MQWLLLTYVFHYSLYSVTQINAVQDTERLMEVARVSDNFYFNCWPSLIISYSYYIIIHFVFIIIMYFYIIMILIDIDYYAVRTALLLIYFRFLKFITKKSPHYLK